MVKLETAAERVYERLEDMILRGELGSGTQLVQRVLAKQLGVSAMPVVEALRWLERDGLVVRVARWGVFVKEWTAEEVREAYLLRKALESEAVPIFMERAAQEARRRLEELNATFNALSAAGDGAAAAVADYELHAQIARGAELPLFQRGLERSMAAILTISSARRFLTRRNVLGEVGLHDAMVAALLGDDVERAQALVRQHHEEGEAKFVRRIASATPAEVAGGAD